MTKIMEKIGFAFDVSLLLFCIVASYNMAEAAGKTAGEHIAKAAEKLMDNNRHKTDENETDSDKETT